MILIEIGVLKITAIPSDVELETGTSIRNAVSAEK